MTFRPETINDDWPAVYELLRPAVARGEQTLAELVSDLLDRRAQLWVNRKGGDLLAAAVTEVQQTPDGAIINGRLLGGEHMADWIDDLVNTIASYARQVKARGIRIEGRMGWEKVLQRQGFSRRAVVMERLFEPEQNLG